jgi:hypothetical protein
MFNLFAKRTRVRSAIAGKMGQHNFNGTTIAGKTITSLNK